MAARGGATAGAGVALRAARRINQKAAPAFIFLTVPKCAELGLSTSGFSVIRSDHTESNQEQFLPWASGSE